LDQPEGGRVCPFADKYQCGKKTMQDFCPLDEKTIIEVETPIPQEFSGRSAKDFPFKKIWDWARKEYPHANLYFQGHKLYQKIQL